MDNESDLSVIQKKWHGSYLSYGIGYSVSLLLTIIAFYFVLNKHAGPSLLLIVGLLGILQAATQCVFFLHVGKEAEPYWETQMFFFMVLVVFIIVLGSLWIMYDLNYRLMWDM